MQREEGKKKTVYMSIPTEELTDAEEEKDGKTGKGIPFQGKSQWKFSSLRNLRGLDGKAWGVAVGASGSGELKSTLPRWLNR